MTSRPCSPICEPRFATAATPGRENLSAGIAKAAVLLGFRTRLGPGLMPWQHDLNKVATEIDPVTGRFAYRQVVLEVMRQQGKTVDLLSMMVARGLRRPGTQIGYTAQTRLDARKRLLDSWWPRIRRSRLSPLIDVRRGSGSEALLFRNGSMLQLISGTEVSGHGDSLDLGVIDEAWAQADNHVEQAIRPAMMTLDAQLWVVSAAGNEKSSYFREKVRQGRAREEAAIGGPAAFFSYSFADDEDPCSPVTWRRRMPALGITVLEETVAADMQLMLDDPDQGLPEFRRAYGCQWPDVANPGWSVITEDAWRDLMDTQSQVPDPVAFAVEVAPGRTMAAIGAAGRRRDGRTHLEVVEYRPGTDWVPGRVAELRRRHRSCAVVIDPSSHAGSLIADLTAAGVEVATPFTARDAAQACGQFYDAARAGQLAHLGQPELSAAMRSAVTRLLADAWAWDRRSPAEDISPLVAVTLAAWGFTKFGRSRVPPYNMLRSVG